MDVWGKVISVLPPLIAVAGFEIGSRIPIRADQKWYYRSIRPLATALVGFIGAYLSYFHQRDAFFKHTDGDMSTAAMLPLSIDGLMIIAAVSLYELNNRIADMNAIIEADAARIAARRERENEVPVLKERSGTTKKDRVAQIVARNPELSITEIATLAGVSYNYAYNLVRELQKAGSAELVVAD
jgi:hypothetical protein